MFALHLVDASVGEPGADDVFVDLLQLNDSIKDEIISNQRMIPPGKSLMAMNGALMNVEDIDLYL